MPAKGTRRPGSRQFIVETWLKEHPGMHRPADIARGTGLELAHVSWALRDLVRDGHVTKGYVPAKNGGRHLGMYGVTAPGAPTHQPTVPADATT